MGKHCKKVRSEMENSESLAGIDGRVRGKKILLLGKRKDCYQGNKKKWDGNHGYQNQSTILKGGGEGGYPAVAAL